ncbi:extracellular solute-binding protein [Paenibacillus gansuensis]|uniref:Extracellular solute-binding protein n=1 Tax=Paenibacillus gansuensis TaxID=306542 RepID=A0ABW5PBI2_9BACL
MNKGVSYSALLILLMSFMLLSACTKDTNQNGEGNKPPEDVQPAQAATDNPYSAPFSNGKFDPPITLSTVRIVGGDVKFKNGETMENNVHTKWAKEKLGIDIKTDWTVANGDALKTKLRLALAANQTMPDVLAFRDDELANELIQSGKFMEVGPLFEKYASASWKEAMSGDPSVWNTYIRDGKKYGIPILDYAYNTDEVLWIRQDWLDKLGMKAPATIDELEKTIEAFSTQDPDGNGKKDTYGLTFGFKNQLNTWMSGVGSIFGAYGALPNQWMEKDGQLVYGSTLPEAKMGLEKLRSWMEKGFVPKDAGLVDEVKASDLFIAGQAGIVLGPHWMPGWPLNALTDNVKTAKYRAYPIPAGPDGKAMRKGTLTNNGVVLINKDMKNPDAFIVYQNYLFDHFANPEVGGEFEFGMAEGYDWANVDGKPTTDTNKIPGGAVVVSKYTLTFDGARIPTLELETLAKLASGAQPVTPFEKIDAAKDPLWIQAGGIVMQQKDISKPEKFVGAPTKTMKIKKAFLDKMEKEMYAKIIYGELPLTEFDAFVEKWNAQGGEQITKEVNEWYQSLK